jgi:hypothetical protein
VPRWTPSADEACCCRWVHKRIRRYVRGTPPLIVRPTTLSYDKLGMKANSGTRDRLGGAIPNHHPFYCFLYNLNSEVKRQDRGVDGIPWSFFLLLIIGARSYNSHDNHIRKHRQQQRRKEGVAELGATFVIWSQHINAAHTAACQLLGLTVMWLIVVG